MPSVTGAPAMRNGLTLGGGFPLLVEQDDIVQPFASDIGPDFAAPEMPSGLVCGLRDAGVVCVSARGPAQSHTGAVAAQGINSMGMIRWACSWRPECGSNEGQRHFRQVDLSM